MKRLVLRSQPDLEDPVPEERQERLGQGTTAMLAIILSACLTTDPNVCRDYKIQPQEEMDSLSCVMYAAPYFVPWAEEHPGWQIKRWHCAPATEDDI